MFIGSERTEHSLALKDIYLSDPAESMDTNNTIKSRHTAITETCDEPTGKSVFWKIDIAKQNILFESILWAMHNVLISFFTFYNHLKYSGLWTWTFCIMF